MTADRILVRPVGRDRRAEVARRDPDPGDRERRPAPRLGGGRRRRPHRAQRRRGRPRALRAREPATRSRSEARSTSSCASATSTPWRRPAARARPASTCDARDRPVTGVPPRRQGRAGHGRHTRHRAGDRRGVRRRRGVGLRARAASPTSSTETARGHRSARRARGTVAGSAGDPDAIEAAVARCTDDLGGLDIVVNNAATNPTFGPMIETEPAAVRKVLEVNVEGALLLTRARVVGVDVRARRLRRERRLARGHPAVAVHRHLQRVEGRAAPHDSAARTRARAGRARQRGRPRARQDPLRPCALGTRRGGFRARAPAAPHRRARRRRRGACSTSRPTRPRGSPAPRS